MGLRASRDVPIKEQNAINISTYKNLSFVQQNLQEQPRSVLIIFIVVTILGLTVLSITFYWLRLLHLGRYV